MHLMTSPTRRSLARFVASSPVRSRTFRTTSPASVAVNDRVPDLHLVEDSPGNQVNLSKELAQGPGLIIGVPAAFSKYLLLPSDAGCSLSIGRIDSVPRPTYNLALPKLHSRRPLFNHWVLPGKIYPKGAFFHMLFE